MPPHLFGMFRGEIVKWHWSEDELESQWSLSVEELALLPGRIDSGRLGCANLLKFSSFKVSFQAIKKAYLMKFWPTSRKDRQDSDRPRAEAEAFTSGDASQPCSNWPRRLSHRHQSARGNGLSVRRSVCRIYSFLIGTG